MRMRWMIVAAALTSACSGGSPTAPAPTPTPTPSTTITGHVTATNGGQPLGGISVALGPASSTTDGAGMFSSTVTPSTSMRTVMTGSGILPRTVYLAASASRDVAVDAIALDAAFDPTFYRQLVRNGFDAAPGSEPIRRWTQNPNLYLQTGVADARTVDMMEAVVRDSVPRWTNGQLAVASVERGTGTREGQAGWLTIAWTNEDIGHCGVTTIGGGLMQFYRPRCGTGCAGYKVYPTIVRHELGHAMGFWHTDNASDVMHAPTAQCDMPISPRELYHAALAYRRPIGNTYPDDDPASVVNLAPMRVY